MKQKLKIGYCYIQDYFHLISEEPDKLELPNNGGRLCPALQDVTQNTFIVRSPFTIHLTYKGIQNNYPNCALDPEKSTLTDKAFNDFITINNTDIWLNDTTPLIQIHPRIVFVTDEKDLFMEIFPPFLEYRPDIPGRWTAAKYNIYNWIRNTGTVFEWMDTSKPLIIKRGDPLMYVRFNTDKKVYLEFINNSKEIVKLSNRNSSLKEHIKYFTREAMKFGYKFRPRKLL